MPSLRSQINMRGVSGTSGSLQRDFAIIKANLNREILNIKKRTTKGLLLACIDVRRDMELTPPLIPIDFGNLRASFFIVTKKSADPTLKVYQLRNANFNKAETPEILRNLKEGHTAVLAEADDKMAMYPIAVMMGFSAYYAAPVHEMIGASSGSQINWKRPGSGPKFFQAALYRNFDKIIMTVKTNAQVKP